MKTTDDQITEGSSENNNSHIVPILGLHPFVWTIGLMGAIVALIFLYTS